MTTEPRKRVIKFRYLLGIKSRIIPIMLTAKRAMEQAVIRVCRPGLPATSKTRKAPFLRCQRYQEVRRSIKMKIPMKMRM